MIQRERPSESELKTEYIGVERKTFTFALKENPRGRFLRISEEVSGRHNNIIIPASGFEDFRRVFDEMAKQSDEIPKRE